METKKRSNLAVFAVLTTITIVVWSITEAYQRLTKTETKTIPPKILMPLSPSLDKETLDTIEKRRVFSKEEVSSFAPSGQAQAIQQPEVTAGPEPNPARLATPMPTPVPSGTVQPSPSPSSQELAPPKPEELPVLEP